MCFDQMEFVCLILFNSGTGFRELGARGLRSSRVEGTQGSGTRGGKGALADPTTASVKIGNENIMFLAHLPPPSRLTFWIVTDRKGR